MRRYLQSRPRWLQAGWLFPLVLLALPNCILPAYEYLEAFDPGETEQTSAVMCDIPKYRPFNANVDCATPAEELHLKSTAHAAIGLAEGDSDSLVLDYSPESLTQCSGRPKKVIFHGPYPSGSWLCLNCETQIGPDKKYVDAPAVCVAKCIDLTNAGDDQPAEGALKYCEANAKVATNFTETCYKGACFSALMPDPTFDDPRRHQEPVAWDVDKNGFAQAVDNTVGKPEMTPEPVDGMFDSGAASVQTIESGDAWIEFEAKETLVSHVLGVSNADLPVAGLKLENIAFALSLNYDDSNIYVLENGVNGDPVGKYAPEERFRLLITDNHDGTAKVSYLRLQAGCKDGVPCLNTEIAPPSTTTISYPLRVFAMFRERPAQLTNVTMVYIKKTS
jgi:hypothetical protein